MKTLLSLFRDAHYHNYALGGNNMHSWPAVLEWGNHTGACQAPPNCERTFLKGPH